MARFRERGELPENHPSLATATLDICATIVRMYRSTVLGTHNPVLAVLGTRLSEQQQLRAAEIDAAARDLDQIGYALTEGQPVDADRLQRAWETAVRDRCLGYGTTLSAHEGAR